MDLILLNRLINEGWEFPDAIFRVVDKFDLDEEESENLKYQYDNQNFSITHEDEVNLTDEEEDQNYLDNYSGYGSRWRI